ncbi:MAG TPA: UDP-N-acetylmuramate dehydrogenase, partial [Gemmatimonadales bacterium]
GPARFFSACANEGDLADALDFAHAHGLQVHILGGGSNTIFRDEGYAGLVAHLTLGGIDWRDTGDGVEATVGAGVDWDKFVAQAVARGFSGVECLSGIPGTAGATPIQNVGAYGQEVADTLIKVTCLNRASRTRVELRAVDCGFGYRTSRFKQADRERFIVLAVTLRLSRSGPREIRYPELERSVRHAGGLGGRSAPEGLALVRDVVLSLRAGKAMVLDATDPNTRSAGSFFTNPVLTRAAFDAFAKRAESLQIGGTIPSFPADGGFKVPAAWLVEQAGFTKGQRSGGVGISARHALALVNYDGTSAELLAFATAIERAVAERFGIRLEREPVVA